MSDNKAILVISDLHCPYHHPDAFNFLRALKKKYRPTRIVNIGDELDFHDLSYHESDPDLYSAGEELGRGQKALHELEKIFPEVDVVESNHGSMISRKARTHGIPRQLLVDPRRRCFGDEGGDLWTWQDQIETKLPNGKLCVFAHGDGKKKNPIQALNDEMDCFVRGHWHTDLSIHYKSSKRKLIWIMTVGCLINHRSYAFEYGRRGSQRPIIGCGVIVNSMPALLPMELDRDGRWTGHVP